MVGALAVKSGLRVAVRRGAAINQQRGITMTRPTCMSQGVEKKIIQEGTGPTPTKGQKVKALLITFYVDDGIPTN